MKNVFSTICPLAICIFCIVIAGNVYSAQFKYADIEYIDIQYPKRGDPEARNKDSKFFQECQKPGPNAAKGRYNWGVYEYRGDNFRLREPMPHYSTAFDKFFESAQLGFVPAYNALGIMLISQDTDGLSKDRFISSHKTDAIKMFQAAIDKDYAPAFYNMGIMYANGDGVEKNLAKAIQFVQRSANRGFAEASIALAEMKKETERIEAIKREDAAMLEAEKEAAAQEAEKAAKKVKEEAARELAAKEKEIAAREREVAAREAAAKIKEATAKEIAAKELEIAAKEAAAREAEAAAAAKIAAAKEEGERKIVEAREAQERKIYDGLTKAEFETAEAKKIEQSTQAKQQKERKQAAEKSKFGDEFNGMPFGINEDNAKQKYDLLPLPDGDKGTYTRKNDNNNYFGIPLLMPPVYAFDDKSCFAVVRMVIDGNIYGQRLVKVLSSKYGMPQTGLGKFMWRNEIDGYVEGIMLEQPGHNNHMGIISILGITKQ